MSGMSPRCGPGCGSRRGGTRRRGGCCAPTVPPPAAFWPHQSRGDADPVTITVTPVRLRYEHTASAAESAYLRGLADGRLIGRRCPACEKVHVPSRGVCPADGVPADEAVELPDVGTVTPFSIVNVGNPGQQL